MTMWRIPANTISQLKTALRQGLLPTEVVERSLQSARVIEPLNAFVCLRRDAVDDAVAQGPTQSDQDMLPLEGVPFAVKDNFCTSEFPTTCGSNMLKEYRPAFSATVVEKAQSAGAKVMGKTNLDEFSMGSGGLDSVFGATKNVWRSGINYRLIDKHGEEVRGVISDPISEDPHDWVVAGGSSSGSAVAVASGVCLAALGSDTGGSVRIPGLLKQVLVGGQTLWRERKNFSPRTESFVSSCVISLPGAWTGIPTLKPSYGLLSRHGLIPLVNSLDVPGIMARCVDDLALVFNCLRGVICNSDHWLTFKKETRNCNCLANIGLTIASIGINIFVSVAGEDPRDSTTVMLHQEDISVPPDPDISGITVGIPQEYYCQDMSREVLESWSEAADHLEKAGIQVRAVSLPHTAYSILCYTVLNACEVASNMARYDGLEYGLRSHIVQSTESMFADCRHHGFGEVVRGRILAGNYFLLRENLQKHYMRALKIRRQVHDDFMRVFADGVDVLLTPVTLDAAPTYSVFSDLDNRTQSTKQDYCSQPVNLAGLPAATVPHKLSSKHLPISIQVIGKKYADSTVLQVCKWLENRFNFPFMQVTE